MNVNDLRPAFFRFGDSRAFSGWKTKGGDYWTTGEVIEQSAALLVSMGSRVMATELLLSQANDLGLYLVKHAEPAFENPERLVFTRDVDMHPLDYVLAGERCVCVRRDRCGGAVSLFMEGYHARLDDDSNCILIEPHHSEELLEALKLVPIKAPNVYIDTQAETIAA